MPAFVSHTQDLSYKKLNKKPLFFLAKDELFKVPKRTTDAPARVKM